MGRMSPFLGRSARKNPADRTVTLIGKPDCHLCEAARETVTKVAADLGCTVVERDITQDRALHDAYWEQIPVVLIDGAQHDFWRVDETRLRRALCG